MIERKRVIMRMIRKLLIDTDVLVDYLRGLDQSSVFLEKEVVKSICMISSITLAELYAEVREGKERQVLEGFLRAFEVIALNGDIARTGGLYRRDYGKSHGVRLADAIIAATAEHSDARLVTLNKKHYPMLKDVLVPYTKK